MKKGKKVKKNKQQAGLESIAISFDEISASLKSIAHSMETNQVAHLENQEHNIHQRTDNLLYVLNNLDYGTQVHELNYEIDILQPMDKTIKFDMEEKYEDAKVELTDFFEMISINLENSEKKMTFDEELDRIANFFGKKYNELSILINIIKHNMGKGTEFALCLKDYPQSTIGVICQTATLLLKMSLLVEYAYRKSPHFLVTARPNSMKLIRDFFNGEWLEHYMASNLRKVIGDLADELRKPFQFYIFENIRIALSSGDSLDLDLVIKINHFFYWIAYKPGSYQRNIAHYNIFSNQNRLDYGNTYVVIGEFDETRASFSNESAGIPVNSLDNFETFFKERLRNQIVERELK